MTDSFPCPKCGRSLPRSGVITIDGQTYPVYQCDECLVETAMFGEIVEVALTFAVDDAGRAFDPANPDDSLPA